MKSLSLEIGLMIVVALIAVGLVEFRPPSPEPPPKTIEEKAQPHQTHPDMLLVAFTLYPDQPPVIDEIKHLAEGRVSTPPPGDNRLKLIGQEGQMLYSLSFAADFFLVDGPAQSLREMHYTYVLPYTPQITKVVLDTPQGEVIYDLPEQLERGD